LRRPNLNRTHTGVGHSRSGRAARLRSTPVTEAPESGAVRESGDGAVAARVLQPRCRADSGAGVVSDFHAVNLLENWKPVLGHGLAGRQDPRISGFSTLLPHD
jgi:hypothetical protein